MPRRQRSKWGDLRSPDEPISRLARRAVRDRLRHFWKYLPLAAEDSADNIEYVHQLRVATRRAIAALDLFAPLTPDARRQWFIKKLAKVRKAAGSARDLDVLLEKLRRGMPGFDEHDLAPVVGQLEKMRDAAQPAIERVHEKLWKRNFPAKIDKLAERVRWRRKELVQELALLGESSGDAAGDSNAATAAAAALLKLRGSKEPSARTAALQGMQAAVKMFLTTARGDLSDVATLHEFRILGKQLRYTIELYGPALKPVWKNDLYPQLAELQDALGAVNDGAAAAKLLVACHDSLKKARPRGTVSQLIEAVQHDGEQAHQRFLTAARSGLIERLRVDFQNALQAERELDEEPATDSPSKSGRPKTGNRSSASRKRIAKSPKKGA